MSVVNDLVKSVVDSALQEILKKTGVRKRRRRRLSPSERITQEIERMIKPAKRQASRKKTTRARSKVRRRGY